MKNRSQPKNYNQSLQRVYYDSQTKKVDNEIYYGMVQVRFDKGK